MAVLLTIVMAIKIPTPTCSIVNICVATIVWFQVVTAALVDARRVHYVKFLNPPRTTIQHNPLGPLARISFHSVSLPATCVNNLLHPLPLEWVVGNG